MVGSKNPVKIDAVREAFAFYFDSVILQGISVESYVSDQPINEETFIGAENRAKELQKINNVYKHAE